MKAIVLFLRVLAAVFGLIAIVGIVINSTVLTAAIVPASIMLLWAMLFNNDRKNHLE